MSVLCLVLGTPLSPGVPPCTPLAELGFAAFLGHSSTAATIDPGMGVLQRWLLGRQTIIYRTGQLRSESHPS